MMSVVHLCNDGTTAVTMRTVSSSITAADQQQQLADAEAGEQSTALVSASVSRRRPTDAVEAAAAGGRRQTDRA